MTDRYEKQPFLRLLDSYVLDAIGKLDEANAKWLVEAEPHFRATYNTQGSWRQIVEAQMQFTDKVPAAIREVWEKGRARFVEANGEEPQPMQFVYMFVDQNFPH